MSLWETGTSGSLSMIELRHCCECCHEWQSVDVDDEQCDWCGGDSYVLADKMLVDYRGEEVEK